MFSKIARKVNYIADILISSGLGYGVSYEPLSRIQFKDLFDFMIDDNPIEYKIAGMSYVATASLAGVLSLRYIARSLFFIKQDFFPHLKRDHKNNSKPIHDHEEKLDSDAKN